MNTHVFSGWAQSLLRVSSLKRTLLLVVVSFCALSAHAQKRVLMHWNHNGVAVPVYEIDSVQSRAPTEEAFAVQLGQRLRTLTAEQGFEFCAHMCRHKDGRWGAVVTTIKSHAVCPILDVCPDGFEPTQADIHSHVHVAAYVPSNIDRLFLRNTYPHGQSVHTHPNEFSPTDFSRPNGYMVSAQWLWVQHGPHDVRRVWKMDTL